MNKLDTQEIERKFLVNKFPLFIPSDECIVKQGYVNTDGIEVRFRSKESILKHTVDYTVSFKSDGDLIRTEVETPITEDTFNRLSDLIDKELIIKEYKEYDISGVLIEISKVDPDTDNEFMYAEIEFASVDEAESFDISKLKFLGKEITYDKDYKMKNYWKRTRGK